MFGNGYEGARRCAGCFGIVTATAEKESGPTASVFGSVCGDGIVFEPYTATVRTRLAKQPQQALRLPTDTEEAL